MAPAPRWLLQTYTPDELSWNQAFGLPQCKAGTTGPRLQAGSWLMAAPGSPVASDFRLASLAWTLGKLLWIQTPIPVQPSPAFGCFHGPSFQIESHGPNLQTCPLDSTSRLAPWAWTIGYRLTPTALVVRFTQMLGNPSFQAPVNPDSRPAPLPGQLLWTQMPDPPQWSPGPDWLAQTQDPGPPTQTQVPGLPSQTQAPGQPQWTQTQG